MNLLDEVNRRWRGGHDLLFDLDRFRMLGCRAMGQRLGEKVAVDDILRGDFQSAAQVRQRFLSRNPPCQDRDLRRLIVEAPQNSVASSLLERRIERDHDIRGVPDPRRRAHARSRHLAHVERPFPPRDGRPEERRQRVGIIAQRVRGLRGKLSLQFGSPTSASSEDPDRFLGNPPRHLEYRPPAFQREPCVLASEVESTREFPAGFGVIPRLGRGFERRDRCQDFAAVGPIACVLFLPPRVMRVPFGDQWIEGRRAQRRIGRLDALAGGHSRAGD